MKTTEIIIVIPPNNTKISKPSLKMKTPSKVAHTNCKKVMGCIMITGANEKALVIKKCPKVAKIATKNSEMHSSRDGRSHTYSAIGASAMVTSKVIIATIVDEFSVLVKSLTSKYEPAKHIVANTCDN